MKKDKLSWTSRAGYLSINGPKSPTCENIRLNNNKN
jgi:hypothetical protein